MVINIRKECNPFDIYFRELDHKYFSSINPNHVSVTTKLKDYVNEFPENIILPKYAKKHNLSEQYVKYCWDEQTRIGLELGSWLHINLENRLQNKYADLSYLLTQEPTELKHLLKIQFIKNYEIQIDKFMEYIKQFNYLGSEIIVGNKIYAGQIDCLCEECIIDFKNDKAIDFTADQRLKHPLWKLKDCNWEKYNLQINMYDYLLPESIRSKFTQKHKIIKFDRYSQNFKVYEVEDYSQYINKIL